VAAEKARAAEHGDERIDRDGGHSADCPVGCRLRNIARFPRCTGP
jgi:hypothetical protein